MIKNITLSSLALILILQINLVFPEDNNCEKYDTAQIEFRKIDSVHLDQALDGKVIEGYKVMFCEKEPSGYEKPIPKLVSENIEVLIPRNQILKIYAIKKYIRFNKKYEIWIYFVLDKEVSSEIVTMGKNNYRKQIALLINGKLIGYPMIRGSFTQYLNNKGQYICPLPTHYTNKSEVEKFLNEYNLKLDDYSKESP